MTLTQLLLTILLAIVAGWFVLSLSPSDIPSSRVGWLLANWASEVGEVKVETLNDKITRLRTERGTHIDAMDEIVRTASEENRQLTDDEEKRYNDALADATRLGGEDGHGGEIGENEAELRKLNIVETHTRFTTPPPVIAITDPPASEGRSLDELLWASRESVEAGSYHRNGQFIPSAYGARNAVEQVMVRDADNTGEVLAPRLTEFRGEDQPKIRQFQDTVADMIMFGLLADRSTRNSRDGFQAAKTDRRMKARFERALRALDVDTAGEGADWVPTGIGASMHEKVRAAGKVAPLFARIDLPTNPWKWPIEGADAVAYRVPEPLVDAATKVAASTPGSGAASFDAEIFGGRTLFSRSIEADSALAILPFARNKLVRAFVDAEEKAIIDGDTDGAHQDSDVGASTTDARTAWDGLRKRGLANTGSDAANAAVTLALLRAARKLMLKWGLNPADLAIIASISAYYGLLDTTEVTTVDKMGAQATILNGQLGAVDGMPLIVSEHFREDLNASGVYDGVTTDRTGLVIVNRGEWAIGQRMALDVEVDDSIYRETYQRVVVGFMREDFQNIGDASANDDTAYLYNLAK
jgi:hypothetical protein